MSALRHCALVLALFVWGASGLLASEAQAGPCDPPNSEIVCENSKAGSPSSVWDVNGAGASNIQGFSTNISVNQGGTIGFKVDTVSADYRLDIYRMGYYAGDGARKVATVQPSVSLPQSQPVCAKETSTGLVDCGNWTTSASWAVPSTAVSGIYFAKLEREDAVSEGSHIFFIVRDDDGESDLLFQTSDTTWQAYNQYGGNSLYVGGPGSNPGRAYKVSYNRPLTTRQTTPEDSPFNAEYPMVRWLERNGYDVSYASGVDSDRNGGELLEHEAFLSVGHDEYWSAEQRANVEAARDAGVHLAFFSGNEIFWKTRWEGSIDGSGTDHRTLVCYKETHANANLDPDPDTWTGTWRDPRFSPPADGGEVENALSGTAFMVNAGTTEIKVPAEDGQMRLWRDTDVAELGPGQTATLAEDTLGYEWDEDLDNGFRPDGLVHLSSTTTSVPQKLQDYGNTYASGSATHHMTLYRAGSGALVFGAGTVQWPWGLDSEHDRGNGPADPNMQQATINLFADMGVQPETLQAGLSAATQTTDDEPPATSIVSPADGATVEVGQSVTINGTATDSTGEGGSGGAVGAVEVSVDGGDTWHPAVGRDAWTYSWAPQELGEATILARAADDSGNLEDPAAEVEVEVAEASCPCSIWDEGVTATQDNDPKAVELGTKFRSDVAGFVTGVRYYRTSGNAGPHVGHLWTRTGTKLASIAFSGESASGWQQALFDTPVAINANTTYVVSYHAPSGRYASIKNYFSVVGVDNPPLHALANNVDGPNGIYEYGPSGGLFADGSPSTFQSEAYLVDVVFAEEVGPDTTPPAINSRTPAPGATEVATGTTVTAGFNEPIDPATIDGARVELRSLGGALVPAAVSYDTGTRTATLDPDAPLQLNTTYTAKVKGGPTGVADLAGNRLGADSTWSFTTVPPPPPPPNEGPGGPILVVANEANPFSRYYGEILRAEGLNEFTVTDVANLTPALLASHDVVVLGEGPLSAGQATVFGDWVQAGGNLIAMRPDGDLAALLGLTPAGGTLGNAYLQVSTGSGPGAGIVGETIQFHGTADRYTLNGAQTIATLYSNATTSTPNPAVTLRSVGPNGGQAAAFSYDLARSVVYTRQGNPAWAGQERDGQAPIRSDDLFFGAKAGDAQPDWVDLNKVAIPQADEQQRLLTNLIGEMGLDRKPLPRFWFLPRDEKAAVVMTGDDHAQGGTAGRLEHYKSLDTPGCDVDAWECVRSTSYLIPNNPLLPEKAAALAADGFEIAVHVSTGCQNWIDREDLEDTFEDHYETFAANYPSLPPPATNRTHCIVWSDWATQAEVSLENGIRFDTNYYYWPGAWVANRPGMFTGSGMPMRFAGLDGSLIDVYQATTQMTDESGQTYPFTANTLLDRALGPEGYYGVFTANMHTDDVESPSSDAIVSSALARGVPIVSARQMLTWIDGRNQSSFGDIEWDDGELSFTIAPGPGANGLRAMVPTTSAIGPLDAVSRGGTPVATTTRTVKGVEYAFFDATAGSYTVTYLDDSLPFISDVQAVAGHDGTATVTWNTNEPANSRVDYGTAPGSLTSSKSSAALVTAHSVQLTGLSANGTYHFRVTSADSEANSVTKPASPLAPLSFSTPPAAPVLSATVPASPSNQNLPKVVGSAAAGATVSLYATAGCTGAPVATGTAAALASPGIEVTVTADATTTFRATATSAGGATSLCSAPLAYLEDSTAPDTQIGTKPASLVNNAVASFTFTGSDPGGSGVASFQCKLDSGSFTACTSPRELTSLAEGSHTFEVRAIDAAGNTDGSPATHTWTVDLTPPAVQIDSGPTGFTANKSPTFAFSVPGATFECSIDTGTPAFGPCSSAGSHTPASPLADGPRTFRVRATDTAGNQAVATRSFTVDATAPDTQIGTKPAALLNSTTANFTFTGSDPGGSGVASFQCKLDSGAFAACTSPRELTGLGEGSHTVEVRAIDAAGNTDASPATHTWTVDLTPPAVQIDSGPTGFTANPSPTFAFSAPGATFECSIDTGTPAFGPCSSAGSHTPASPLADGPRTFRVRATDPAGNQATATRSFTVDATAPDTQIGTKPAALLNSTTANFTFTGSDPGGSGVASFQCKLDSGAFTACTTPREYTALGEGAHTVEVRAIDTAGNTDASPATHTWTVDLTPPDASIDGGPTGLTNDSTPTFAFSAAGATFECSIDKGTASFGPCSAAGSHTPSPALADGAWTFRVRATDAAGNQATATRGFTVDATAPDTQITAQPDPASPLSAASFSFSGSDGTGSGVAGYQCRRDSAQAIDWQPCSSPRNENSLADGPHSFEVRAIDQAGNVDPEPAAYTWTIDTKAPDTQIGTKPASLLNSTTANFTFSGSDPGGSGVALFQCKLDSGSFAACTTPREYTALGEGSHTVEVRAIDAVGNIDASPATHTWTVDLTPPAVQIDSGPTGFTANPSPTFAFSAPGATFECSIDTGTPAFGPCSSAGSHTPASPLADGPRTFRVRATDPAGNQATATRSFTVDATAPDTQIGTKPAALLNSTTANFTFTGSDPGGSGVASFQCKLDSGAFAACTSPRELTGLGEGSHTVEVRAIDATGNTDASPATHTWTVDLTPPSVSIDGGPTGLTNDSTPTFAFSAAGATFECSIDKGTASFGPCSAAGSHTPSPALADGAWTFRVRATDAAGNQATATRGFTVDATAPDTQITAQPQALTNSATATFSFTGTDPGGSGASAFQCRLDSTDEGAWTPCSAPHGYADLDEGAHEFEVRAVDAAGNADPEPAVYQWNVDTEGPDTQITGAPATLTNSANASFSFTGSDPGGSGIASFQCRRDSTDAGDWQPCTSTLKYSALAEGAHTFHVRAVDAAGNPDPEPAAFAWTIDTKAPDTQITAQPAALTNATAASFSFTGSDPGGSGAASFECRLDSGAWAPCESPRAYTGLGEGGRKFEVSAIDGAGNTDASPASYEWQIDLTPPAVQIDDGPAGATGDSTPTFAFSSEPGATFQCSIDKGTPSFGPCSGGGSHTPSPALADGAWTFRVRATDIAGNQAVTTRDFQVEAAIPDAPQLSATVPASPANHNNPKVLGSAQAGTTVRLYAGGDCSGAPLATAPASALDAGIEISVAANAITQITATATSPGGNASACSAPISYLEDSTAPDTQIGAKPASLVKAITASFTFTGSDPGGSGVASFQCKLDSGAFTACTSPREYTGLGEGSHSFEVRAVDQAGNIDGTPAAYAWTVDLTAPQLTVDSLSKALLKAGETSELTWHADEDGSFELRLGGADCNTGAVLDSGGYDAPGPDASSVSAGDLAEGANSLRLCLTDAAGNRAQATATISRDTGAPDTQIGTKPASLVNSATANFTFSGSDPGGSGVASFQCKLDSGAFTACTTPREYTGLGEGAHTVEVRAIDAAGNVDASAATHTWTIDLTPPSVSIDGGPTGFTANPSPTFAFSAAGATFECSIDTGTPSFGPCASAGSHTPASPLADGPRTFRVRATDTAGNQATATRAFTIDATAPDTQIGTKPASLVNSPTANFTFTGSDPGGSGVASFQCKLDSGAFTACTSPREYTGLGEGSHTVEVRAIDAAGNTDASPATHTWTVDLTPPAVQIDSGPTGLTNDSTPTFAFSAPGATFECSIDKGTASFGPCSAAGSHTPSPALVDGAWTFRVRATDAAGNQAVATRGFTVDTAAPPAPTLSATTPPSPANDNTPQIVGSAPAGTTVRLYANAACSGAPIATVPAATLETGIEATVADDSTTSFAATATTAAENSSGCSTPRTYVEDSTSPDTQIGAKPAALVNSAVANFTFTGSDPGGSGVASFQCKLDSGSFTLCTSPREYTSLIEGSHSFEVRAIDAAGNTDASPATHTWTVDLTPPAVQIDSGPTGLTNDSTPTFAFSAPGASFECSIDKGTASFGPCSAAGSHTPSPALADGAWTFRVRGTDTAGNSATATGSFTVDATAPDTQIGAKPAALVNSAVANFTFTGSDPGGSGVASFQCKLDSGAFTACTSPREYTSLAEGPHTVEVRAIDTAGNTDASPATHTWTIDLTPPAVQIDSGPTGLTNDSTPTFAFSAPGATFECSIDKGTASFGPCSAAGSHTPSPALADGAWTFRVRATDAAGNSATATRSFTIDTAAPAAPTLSATVPASPANDNTPQIGGSAPAATTIRLYTTADCSGGPVATVSAAQLQSGVEVTVDEDATTSFSATATSMAGNVSACSAPISYVEDSTSPDTQIGTKPAALVNSATANFTFTGSDPGGSGVASFQCKLDSGSFAACTTPRELTSLGEGSHTVEVRAIDAAGNVDASPATHTWTIDLTPPAVQIDSGPTGFTANPSPTFAFSAAGATFGCSIDTGTPAFGPCSSAGSHTPASPLADGPRTFRVRATDPAGNQATATRAFTIDATAPDTQIGTKPAALVNSAAASFTFSGEDGSGSGSASFQCRLDSSAPSAWASCASPHSLSGLSQGTHTFEVRAIDAAGNVDSSAAAHTWTVDTTAPATQIDSSPPVLAVSASAGFTFSGSDPGGSGVASFQCRLDSTAPGAWVTCPSPRNLSGLAEGAHTFEVRAIDQAGNSDPTAAAHTWTVDTAPPVVQIDSGPTGLTNDPTPTFAFSSEPGATFECSADTGTPSFAPCSAAGSHTPASALADGPRTFRVRATDAAGHQTIATRAFTVDTVAPETEITTKPPTLSTSSGAGFAFTGVDSGGLGVTSFECRRDSADPTAWQACASPREYASLVDGAHLFEVRAIDAAGNADPTPASHAWTIDTTTPQGGGGDQGSPQTPIVNGPGPDIPDAVRFVRIRHNPKSGATLLVFEVPGPGLLSARAPELTAREGKRGKASAVSLRKLRLWQKSIKPSRIRITDAGLAEVPIILTPEGKRMLVQSSRLKLKVVARFKAADGDSTTWKITVTLKRVESLTSTARSADPRP